MDDIDYPPRVISSEFARGGNNSNNTDESIVLSSFFKIYYASYVFIVTLIYYK